MTVQPALTAFDRQRKALLDDLFAFLRFPTISAQPAHAGDMLRCAQWLAAQLESAGLAAEVVRTAGHPVVFADSGPVKEDSPAMTLLVYGHYDVQPVGDEKLWDSPPFEPTIRDGAIFARGSADDKGQVMTHVAALRCLHGAGVRLPVRIKLLIEGEEEIGSPNLPGFVREHRERLACDYVVLSDTAKHDAATPALAYSSRGLVYKQIAVEGPARDLHSGQYGGAVANPANVLAAIIASLHDEKRRVTIPGFYDDVLPLSEAERPRLTEQDPGDEELKKSTGAPAPYGEAGYSSLERRCARPTLDVNGLWSGYTGDGSATIIPARAMAKVSMRLVANQDPDRISQAFDEAVRRACPPAVRLQIATFGTCGAYVAPTDSPGMRAARQALAEAYGRPAILTREGGTLPILPLFKQVLGADSLMLGFAMPDCNLHSPNEFFHVSDFETGTRCVLHFLGRISDE